MSETKPETSSIDSLCELLPWYLNGTLDPETAGKVEAHLSQCLECRDGRELWQEVQRLRINDPVPIGDTGAGLAAMNRRLDRYLAGAATDAGGANHYFDRVMAALASPRLMIYSRLAAITTVLLLGSTYLGLQRQGSNPGTAYVTLSDSPDLVVVQAHQYQFRVLFKREATEAQKQEVLVRYRAQVIAGPTPKGVYTLAVPADGVEPRKLASELRDSPVVQVAEWISGL